jgi:hypothetical protein
MNNTETAVNEMGDDDLDPRDLHFPPEIWRKILKYCKPDKCNLCKNRNHVKCSSANCKKVICLTSQSQSRTFVCIHCFKFHYCSEQCMPIALFESDAGWGATIKGCEYCINRYLQTNVGVKKTYERIGGVVTINKLVG